VRIVVVEDELRTRTGIINCITRMGQNHQVVGSAGDGIEGIRVIQETKPDLILADVRMPLLGGLEMLQRLKDLGNATRSVVLSGYAEFKFAKKAIHLGVQEYLLKPITVEDLRLTLEKVKATMPKTPTAESDGRDMDDGAEAGPYSAIVVRSIRFINEHSAEDISLEDIAGRLHVSSSYLSTLFAKEVGTNYSAYLRALRIRKAKDLLLEGRRKVYEIASDVGYHDAKYFCRVFKEVTGMSPGAYLHRNRQRL
jgi:two-component system, response regulator YesN